MGAVVIVVVVVVIVVVIVVLTSSQYTLKFSPINILFHNAKRKA